MLFQGKPQLEDPVFFSARRNIEVAVRMKVKILTRVWVKLKICDPATAQLSISHESQYRLRPFVCRLRHVNAYLSAVPAD